MSEKEPMIKLFGVERAEVGGGWCQAFEFSEYEITKANFLKFCRRTSKSEPEELNVLLNITEQKIKEHLGL